MDLVKCPRCGENFSPSYRRCPFCEEAEKPRRVKNRMRSGHRVTEKKKTYSGRGALIVILLLVLALLTWMLFGDTLVERFAKPAEPPVSDVTPPVETNDDPFYDPNVGDDTPDVTDPDAVEPPAVDTPSADVNTDASNAKLSSEDFTASVGESVTLKVTGTDAAVIWSIDDSSVASISESGVVTGISAGRTEAHAKVGGKTLTCVVRIK